MANVIYYLLFSCRARVKLCYHRAKVARKRRRRLTTTARTQIQTAARCWSPHETITSASRPLQFNGQPSTAMLSRRSGFPSHQVRPLMTDTYRTDGRRTERLRGLCGFVGTTMDTLIR